ncbi:uncharacterized protein LOC122282241 [Carya illinoinensis]|uniref:uncharacterized protein LOC122282241 n=1 Tax=Carya illinoinensis TaxID=32201 RepID=UPI001C71E7FA|nr:uncharacterized protein LOC122282241 [Carya illinoinensis]
MEKFRNALDWCSLNLIFDSRTKIYLANNRSGQNFTKEQLDRALANPSWLKEASCIVNPAVKSDHSALHINLGNQRNQGRPQSKLLRFEVAWTLKEGYATTLKEAWGKANPGESHTTMMTRRLSNCSFALTRWNTTENRSSPTEIKQKMERLSELHKAGRGDQVNSILKLQGEIEKSLDEEDLKLKKMAKQHWLKMGDKNTKFYHLHATQRRKANRITQVFTTSNPSGIA